MRESALLTHQPSFQHKQQTQSPSSFNSTERIYHFYHDLGMSKNLTNRWTKNLASKACIQVSSRKSNFIFKYPDPSLTFFIIYNFWQGAHFWWAKKSIICFHIVYDAGRVVVFFPSPIKKKTLNLKKELKNNLSKTSISVHTKQFSSRKKGFVICLQKKCVKN